LIAEDDDDFRAVLCEGFQDAGYIVTPCRHGLDLVRELRSLETPARPEEFDVIVSDIRMPGVSGLSVLAGLRDIEGIPPIVLITAFGDEETHAEAECLGAAALLDKPFEMAELLEKARDVMARSV
jgi:CheY-like chemotaxis protein